MKGIGSTTQLLVWVCLLSLYLRARARKLDATFEPSDRILECTEHRSSGKCKIEDINLANGTHRNEGRIEVKINGVWGSICSNDWDIDDAQVACRMLGFDGAVEHLNDLEFGRGEGPIWMDLVQCTGKEKSFSDCIYQGLPIYDCDENYDIAGAICKPNDPEEIVKLEYGSNNKEGTVYIKREGTWGTICDDNWSIEAAEVVCNMLNFTRAIAAPKYAHFGEGEGPIWLRDVTCSIDETHISGCEHDMWGEHNCDHGEDAGVVCVSEDDACLPGNNDCNQGICGITSGECGCDPGFCGKFCSEEECVVPDCGNGKWFEGFSEGGQCRCTGNYGLDDDGRCTVEGASACDPPCVENMGYCKEETYNRGANVCDCIEGQELCTGESSDEVRLLGGLVPHQGRVEIYHDGEWGTICDDLWEIEDANVICTMLGYTGAIAAVHDAYFGKSEFHDFWLDDVRCTGNEQHIAECIHRPWGDDNCGDSEAAGVVCAMPCDASPCKNKGKCRNLNKHEFECVCTPAFKGTTCETPC